MHVVSEARGKARVIADLSNGVLGKLRQIPSGVTWDGRDAIFTVSSLNLKYIRDTFPNVQWDDALKQQLFLLDARAKEAAALVDLKYQKLSKEADTFPYKRPPLNHQRKAVLVSAEEPAYAILAEAGTGKSQIIVVTAAKLFMAGKIQSMLVFSENGLHYEWPKHFAEDWPVDVPYEVQVYSARMGDDKVVEIERMVKHSPGLKVLAMNIEALSSDYGVEFAEWFIRKHDCMMVIDEFQSIGVHKSKRSKAAVKLGKEAKYRRGMTGTLVVEGLERCYDPFQYLDPKILDCKTYTEFLNNYTVRIGKFHKIVSYKNVDDLMAKIEPYSFAIDKKDCLDLPPVTYVRRPTELSADQRKAYVALRDEFVAEVAEGKWVEAEIMIKRLIKLQQISGGFVKLADGQFVDFLQCPRIRSAVDLLSNIRGRALVWCAFQRDVVNLSAAMDVAGISYVQFYGGLDLATNLTNMQRFHDDPTIKVFIGTPRKGGKGFTLNEADTVLYYSHNWSLELRTQSEARNYRPGQDKPVTYYDMYCPGTVDARILSALEKKQNIAKLLKAPDVVLEWLEDELP